MSKYVEYYNKAVDLYKAGKYDLTPELIYGSEFYTEKDRKLLEGIASEVMEKAYNLAIEYHPTWLFTVKSGADTGRCLEAWHRDDPKSKWLDELKHIEAEENPR